MQGRLTIRGAHPEDAEALLRIYAPYVEETAITFEYDVPTAEEFEARIAHVLEKYPYLVAERDGEIIGYAYASPVRTRAAYGWCVETSVYVRRDARGQGAGGALYRVLEKVLARQHIASLYACITSAGRESRFLTTASIAFHAHMGYEETGRFPSCGYKFGEWFDVVWMHKRLNAYPDEPLPVECFEAVRGEFGL